MLLGEATRRRADGFATDHQLLRQEPVNPRPFMPVSERRGDWNCRDGFASMNADAEGGALTTRLLPFQGGHLFVNANAANGEVHGELLDGNGNAIVPFSCENCQPLRKDSSRMQLQWKRADNLTSIGKQPVRVRFHLTRAV